MTLLVQTRKGKKNLGVGGSELVDARKLLLDDKTVQQIPLRFIVKQIPPY